MYQPKRYVKPLKLVALDLLAAFVVELKVAFAGFRDHRKSRRWTVHQQ